MANYVAKIRIVDPDVVDRVQVDKKNTKNDATVNRWDLGNYKSTEDVDLNDGKFYLRLWPYFENVDPLPVWFKIYNEGERKLIAKCVLSELQRPGAKQFKDLGIVESGKTLVVPACLRLEYRVLHFWLGSLDVRNINGITIEHRKKLVSIGIVVINDMLNKNLQDQVSRILGVDTTTILERVMLSCSISVSSDKFAKIGNEYMRAISKWSADKIAEEAGVTEDDVRKLLSQLNDLSQAIEGLLFEEMRLRDIFRVAR
ncbi:MAG: hypothetical protein WBD09_06035 [Halobacteriota archaeon]